MGQLEGARSEVARLQEGKEKAAGEAQQLTEELSLLTRENQAVHDELRRALEEKESLRLKVQEYAQSMLRCQETIAAKEQENADLLQSYQSLSDEVDKLQSSSQQSLGEVSSSRAEIATLLQVSGEWLRKEGKREKGREGKEGKGRRGGGEGKEGRRRGGKEKGGWEGGGEGRRE